MTDHTPTPWINDEGVIKGTRADGYPIVAEVCYPSIDAAFIVRACNAHADMLAALRMCAHFIENVSESTPDRTERFFACRESWRRAIARAEGR